jgi:hypothetical protein
MPILQQIIQNPHSGTQNVLPDEQIASDAASDSLNWITRDGSIVLANGRQAQGGLGASGKSYGEHTGYRADGTSVRFRKVDGTIQALVAGTWTDVITGLTATADYVFSNYQSLAGAFTYAFGVDGIYKITTANPTSFTSLYDSTKNFKGFGFIDKGRTFLWGRSDDPSGLYGSYIDAQSGAVYTTVSGEATTSLSGTLAFKAGGSTRTCFGVAITLTGSGEVYKDNFNGVLTGSLGGTGTINYTTGAYTLTNSGVGTVVYLWENTNVHGVTDFSHSAPRLAGEGFVVRQDAGGDAIVRVLPLDGSYFSLKKHSCYRFALDATDLNPVNVIFRTDIGVPSLRAATATGEGIMFMNTASSTKPRLWFLKQNPLGDTFDVNDLFPSYDFSPYTFNDCLMDFWDRYVVVACALNSTSNNRLIMCDIKQKTVDATYYGIRTSTKDNGFLYGGDTVSKSTFELFTGYDDLGIAIQNYWVSKDEPYGPGQSRANRFLLGTSLKKVRRLRIGGTIGPNQSFQVYMSPDGGDFSLVGTIVGSADYVDYDQSLPIGNNLVGVGIEGGGDNNLVHNFFAELRVKSAKFRTRRLKFVAKGIGYISINYVSDYDIWISESRLAKPYRIKQNVSKDGVTTNLANPQY